MCCQNPAQGISIMAILGLLVSTYAFYVEYQMAGNINYEAACDIGGMSCTKVFESSYAHILSHWGLVEKASTLDLGLAEAGLALYTGFFLYPILHCIPGRKYIVLAVSSASVCFSLYLLYVLKVILGEFCIVCTSFHAVNFVMFVLVIREFKMSKEVNGNEDSKTHND